ncbi:MAG: F0F1 ATP synthase subunit A [Planctomycetia bacterium]|nr:F0F1 ATP synthase subunit A [Planctomycetia bacterium]MDO5113039.1 F0F1 ATP synthase subunit A [Planctomycetia bacterium]
MDPNELGSHVADGTSFHFIGGTHFDLPVICGLQITKFMVLELLVAVLMLLLFIPLAMKVKKGVPVHGRFSNLLEVFLVFLRDDVARPAIGHGADKFLPLIWTTFFFVLFMNLFGMIPGGGSPTASLSVTGCMAIIAFGVLVFNGSRKLGPVNFWLKQVPHMDVPAAMGIILKPMLFLIEVFGLLVKHFVLAVRLFANMFAGHLVLAVFTSFIGATAAYFGIWLLVSVPSMLVIIAIDFLEIFVAFLQAYIFTFLMSLFIGMAAHPH